MESSSERTSHVEEGRRLQAFPFVDAVDLDFLGTNVLEFVIHG